MLPAVPWTASGERGPDAHRTRWEFILRLRQIACFVRVCELGSITRAAAELNIAQPALGLQIRGLEHEFGAALVVRSSKGVKPTAAGELLLEWGRTIQQQNRDIRRRMKELHSDRPLSLTLGMTSSLTQMLAAPIIETVRESLPSVGLKIVEGLSQYIAEWIDDERVDIGLGFGPFEGQSVHYTALMRDRLFYLSAPGTPDGTITLAEVLSMPLAVPDDTNSIRHTVESAARSLDLPVIGNYEIASIQAAREIARRGIAGAIAPYGGVATDHQRGELSVRMIVSPMLERTLYLMRRNDRTLNETENSFIRIVIDALYETTRRVAPPGAYVELEKPSA